MSFIQTHQPCNDCGSSDGLAVNDDGWSHCFVCQTRKKVDDTGESVVQNVVKFEPKSGGNYRSIPSRNKFADSNGPLIRPSSAPMSYSLLVETVQYCNWFSVWYC